MNDALTIVLDVGKTLAKLSLWAMGGVLVARKTCARSDDVEGWLATTLTDFAKKGRVTAIIPVGHGAAAAIIKDGRLALPVRDYEEPIPDDVMAEYRAQRDAFAETGSPALPDGLNLGAQLHWLEAQQPEAFDGATIMPFAQYWAWLLSGIAASEVTSLGCHTDLWNPAAGDFSAIAKRRGWAAKLARLRQASDVLGTITPGWAARTGLPADVKIHCGLHDSNAALIAARGFAEIADNEATVLSTGTWFIAMRTPAAPVDLANLPEVRDCLVNVDAFGRAIPSARFMGGREIETLIEIDTRRVDIKPDQPALLAAVPDVLAGDAMLLPSFAPGCGPFPGGHGQWINRPEDWFARRAATCLYAALVTDAMLDLVGSKETLLVEGRFAEAAVFVRALATLRPDLAVYTANAHNDVSFGALRLLDPALRPHGALQRVMPLPQDLSTYKRSWQERVP